MELEQALKEWQEALRLQDWDITVKVLSEAEYAKQTAFPGEDVLAETTQNTLYKTAEIILKEGFSELTLVHEFSHIITGPFQALINEWKEKLSPSDIELIDRQVFRINESVVEHIAKALLKVRDMAHESYKTQIDELDRNEFRKSMEEISLRKSEKSSVNES